MKQFYQLIFSILTMASSLANAQVFPYNFSVLNEPYNDLQGATILTTSTWDDPEFDIPIGFDFEYFGAISNTLTFIGFGSTFTFNGNYYVEPVNVFYAYASDLVDRGFGNGQVLSPISSKVDGNPGSRVFKLEFKNAGFYNEMSELGTSTDYINFQLWLYEGSNNIEIRFGPNSILQDALVHDFNGSPFIGFAEQLDFNNYTLGGVWWYLTGNENKPSVEYITQPLDIYSSTFLANDPPDGLVYRFEFSLTDVKESDAIREAVTIQSNLVHDFLNINVLDASMKDVKAIVYNQIGQTVAVQPLQYGSQSIGLGHLAAGRYYLTIRTNEGVYSERILKY